MPADEVVVVAYELWHESFDDPFRWVNDNAPLSATLEADAPRDASTTVTFIACPCEASRPPESDEAQAPSIELSRGDLAGFVWEAAEAARGSDEPWELRERFYTRTDTSAPALTPCLSYEVSVIRTAGQGVQISALYGDFANVAVPAVMFRLDEYPGLAR